MESIFRLEFYILLLVYPVVMGLLYRHKRITLKRLILITNTAISILFETSILYFITLDKGLGTVFVLSLDDWILSISLSAFVWLFLFLVTKPFHKN